VKKTTNVTNARLTLEFNVQGLPGVRVKLLKSQPINSGVDNSRRWLATTFLSSQADSDAADGKLRRRWLEQPTFRQTPIRLQQKLPSRAARTP
jgi:hypothetical protein